MQVAVHVLLRSFRRLINWSSHNQIAYYILISLSTVYGMNTIIFVTTIKVKCTGTWSIWGLIMQSLSSLNAFLVRNLIETHKIE